jgi:hypothetical protein
MFRPIRPSSGALKFGRNCCAFRATAFCVFIFTMFLNEVGVVPPCVPHVLSFFRMSVAYQPITVALDLRHELSSPARALGSWVLIPLKACMFVYYYFVFVLSCTGSGLATDCRKIKKLK